MKKRVFKCFIEGRICPLWSQVHPTYHHKQRLTKSFSISLVNVCTSCCQKQNKAVLLDFIEVRKVHIFSLHRSLLCYTQFTFCYWQTQTVCYNLILFKKNYLIGINTQNIFRGQQKVYILKRIDSFDINLKMLKMFCNAHLESVLTFCIVCWFGGTAETLRNTLRNIISTGL